MREVRKHLVLEALILHVELIARQADVDDLFSLVLSYYEHSCCDSHSVLAHFAVLSMSKCLKGLDRVSEQQFLVKYFIGQSYIWYKKHMIAAVIFYLACLRLLKKWDFRQTLTRFDLLPTVPKQVGVTNLEVNLGHRSSGLRLSVLMLFDVKCVGSASFTEIFLVYGAHLHDCVCDLVESILVGKQVELLLFAQRVNLVEKCKSQNYIRCAYLRLWLALLWPL